MATIILGQHADALTVRLTEGDGAELVATLVDSTGAEVDWTAAPTLSFAHSITRDVIADHVASIAGPVASWELSRADVDEIAAGSLPRRAGQLLTYARITTPDTGDADGHVEYAGKVDWRDGWTAGDRSQRVTFTLPGVPGPPGPPGSGGGGGSDALTIVNGGTVTLDDTLTEGSLRGYRVKAAATFTAAAGTVDLSSGVYTFERTADGWTYYAAAGTALGTPPVTGWAFEDTFAGMANGTTVSGRTTPVGNAPWTLGGSDTSYLTKTADGVTGTVDGAGWGWLTLPENRFKVTCDVKNGGLWAISDGDDADRYLCNGNSLEGQTIAGTTGTVEFIYDTSTITVSWNGTHIPALDRARSTVADTLRIGGTVGSAFSRVRVESL